MPLLKTLNSVANYINQGGKRNGSFAVYLEPYHPDIFTFLDAKKNHGAEERREMKREKRSDSILLRIVIVNLQISMT
jgi:ribonucleotide reductase alpha subunit